MKAAQGVRAVLSSMVATSHVWLFKCKIKLNKKLSFSVILTIGGALESYVATGHHTGQSKKNIFTLQKVLLSSAGLE